MRKVTKTPRSAYNDILAALDLIKGVQARNLLQPDPLCQHLVLARLAEARAALDVAAQSMERERNKSDPTLLINSKGL